jgi:asparagine synthase (glutamine-hydrolysing)
LNIVKADINILDHFDEMIWHLDEPQADAAPLNVLNIAQLAREKGIKVLLGGTGGDDIFSGYRRHQALNFEKYFKLLPTSIGSFIKKAIAFLPNNNAFTRRLRKIVTNLDKSTLQRMSGYFNWLPNETVHSLFSNEWQEKLKNYNPNLYLEHLSNEIPDEKSLLNQMLYWEIKSFLVDHNLNYTDKMGMAVGVEARVPFLDTELVDFSLTIPHALKMKNGEAKYILKKVAERYLPKEIIYRPKTGFGAPVRKWITSDMDEMIKERLSLDNINRRGIFNHDKIWELIEANKKGEIDASYSIWAILAIDSWITQFVKQY